MDNCRRDWAPALTAHRPEEVANSKDNNRDRDGHRHLPAVCHPLWEALEADRDRDRASSLAEDVRHLPEHERAVVGVGVAYTRDTDSHRHRDSAAALIASALAALGQVDKNYQN